MEVGRSENKRMDDIGYTDRFGTEQSFKSNDTQVCLECGIPITDENDSGWELSLIHI